jgi:RNA polymerase sigma factor (sigma-70 family)
VSDPGELKLVQSFLTAPSCGKCPTLDETMAWLLFYRTHVKLIRTVLKRRGVHESDVDDIQQQVWIAVVKRLRRFENDPSAGTVSGYVGAIAGYVAGRHVRRRLKRTESILTTELESTLLDPGPGALSEREWKERQDRALTVLAAARSSLSDEDHRMLVMRCIDGHSVREVAIAFRISEGCAKKRLQRAVQAIKALSLRRGDF